MRISQILLRGILLVACISDPIKHLKPVFEDVLAIRQILSLQLFVFAFTNGTVRIYDSDITTELSSYRPCSSTLKSLQPIPFSECLLVGCTEQIRIDCYNSSRQVIENAQKFQKILDNQTMQAYLMWPFVDIHIQPETIYTCTLENLNFNCIVLRKDITNTEIIYLNTHTNSVKTIKSTIDQQNLYTFMYTQTACPILLEQLKKPIYDFVEGEFLQFYTWTDEKFYSTNSADPKFDKLWKLQEAPSVSPAMGFSNSEVYFQHPNGSLLRLLAKDEFQISTNYDSIWDFHGGFFGYKSGRNLVMYLQEPPISGYPSNSFSGLVCDMQTIYEAIFIEGPLIIRTNQVNQTNQTSPNQQSEPVDEQPVSLALCGQGCDKCYNQTTCSVCRSGYQSTQDNTCDDEEFYSVITSAMNLPYSIMAMKIAFPDIIEELWFYEYHDISYSHSAPILQFIGGVNRDKYIPSYVKKTLLPGLYKKYSSFKLSYTKNNFSTKIALADHKFLQNENQPPIFFLVASKMYLWNYAIAICIFLGFKILNKLTKKCSAINARFRQSSVNGAIGMVLLDAHLQFISFMFFRSYSLSFSLTFSDKLSLVFAILYMFIAFFFAFAGFVLYSNFCSSKKFMILFPYCKKNSKFGFAFWLFVISSRKIVLGAVQSFYSALPAQVLLLIIMNGLTLKMLWHKRALTVMPQQVSRMKRIIFLLLLIFNINTALKMGKQVNQAPFDAIQLLCICGMGGICLVDFLFLILKIGISFLTCEEDQEENVSYAQGKPEQIQHESRKESELGFKRDSFQINNRSQNQEFVPNRKKRKKTTLVRSKSQSPNLCNDYIIEGSK